MGSFDAREREGTAHDLKQLHHVLNMVGAVLWYGHVKLPWNGITGINDVTADKIIRMNSEV